MSDYYNSYVSSFAPDLREDEDDGYQPVYETLKPANANHTRRIATEPKVNLEELGCTIERNPVAVDYEDFLSESLKTARVDISNVKSLQASVRQLPQSSDSVVRRLTSAVETMSSTIVGMATMIDGLQMRLQKQSVSIVNASHQITKLTRMELLKGAFFGEKNVKREWIIPQRAPFKTDLKALIRTWVPSTRTSKGDFATICTDFARHYFVRACNPSEAIQQFSVRVSSRGRSKKEELKDLPESIVTTLHPHFMLEAMGLGQPGLDCTSDELKERSTDFWRGLGRTDKEREAALDYRQSCRQDWRPSCRVSIAKTLSDIRQYVVQSSRLLPKPKRRKITQPPPEEEDTEYSSNDLNLEPAPRPSQVTQPSASTSKE
ncbi:hypothetical protein Aduo_000706 [Ancylostoma duodenale]